MPKPGGLMRAGMALSIALMLGRVSGLLRELQLAALFGVSRQADIAVLLLTLPDMLVGLLLAGGLSAALVPRFRQMPADAAAMLFRRIALAATVAFGIAGAALALVPDVLLALLAPGIAHPSQTTGRLALVFVALALPLSAASGVVTAYLNANDRYFVAGLGTLMFNLCVIAALFLGSEDIGAILPMLGFGIAAGAIVRLATQAVAVPRASWRSRAGALPPDPRLARAFMAGIGAVSLSLLVPVLVRGAASLLSGGAVATFNYAQKLTELPVGILITTMSTVALTSFSGLVASGDEAGLAHAVRAQVRRSMALGLLVVVFGLSFVSPLVELLFSRGAMDAHAVERVAVLARVALVQVPFVAMSTMAAALLNARLRTGEVLRLTAYCLAALPIVALPGVLLKSDQALMGAVVVFQALVAIALGRRAGFRLWGHDGLLDARLGVAMVIVLFVTAAAAEIASIFGFPAWLTLGMGGGGFAAAMLGMRYLVR